MTKLKNSKQESNGEYIIYFSQTTEITEECTENSVVALCEQIFTAQETWGYPVKVMFPNGKVYYWGKHGTLLAQKFIIDGTITEHQFLRLLENYNDSALVNATLKLDKQTVIVKGWLSEIRICEQRTQEAIAAYSKEFDYLRTLRATVQKIEMELLNGK